jgi:hypothetical protein
MLGLLIFFGVSAFYTSGASSPYLLLGPTANLQTKSGNVDKTASATQLLSFAKSEQRGTGSTTPKHGVVPAASAVAAAATASFSTTISDDMALVEQRLVQGLLPYGQSHVKEAVDEAQKLATAMVKSNCTWPDIDYNEYRRAGWPMESHLGRSLTISVGWHVMGNTSTTRATRAALLHAAQCSLQFWLDRDFLNPNWFDNMITTPQQTSNIALLLGAELAAAAKAKVLELTSRSVWQGCPKPEPKCGSPSNNYRPWLGANLVYMLSIQINRGVLTRNETVVGQAFEFAFASCIVSPQGGDGIMQDASFHQHGPQVRSR